MNKLVIIIILPLALIGCVSPIQNIPNDYVLKDKWSKGIAVLSLTYSGTCVKSLKLLFGEANLTGLLLAMWEQNMLDWGKWCEEGKQFWRTFAEGSHQSEIGRLFVIELPAGDHEFIQTVLGEGSRGAYMYYSVKFSVFARKTTYIGNIDFRLRGIRYKLEMRLRDMRERDLSLFAMKYPNLRKEQLVVELPAKIGEYRGCWWKKGGC